MAYNDGGNMDSGKTTQQSGERLDTTFPDGVGKPSEADPVLPSRQPVRTPGDITPRRRRNE